MARKAYTIEDLQAAIVENEHKGPGVSARSIALKHGVPISTLHDHAHAKSHKIGAGGPTVLAPSEEQEIVISCQVLAEMGFGLTKDLVEVVVMDYIKENNIKVPIFSIQSVFYTSLGVFLIL